MGNNDPSLAISSSLAEAARRGEHLSFKDMLATSLKKSHPEIPDEKIPAIASRLTSILDNPDLLPVDPGLRTQLLAIKKGASRLADTQNRLASFYAKFSNIVDLNKPRNA